MYLSKLVIRGLKVGSGEYVFDPKITMFFGENGSGKTTILQAIHLLLRGKTPMSIGYATTGKDILALSPTGQIEIRGEWVADDGLISVTRKWYRDGKTVKETLEQSIDPQTKGVKQGQALLNFYFGNIPEIWNPESFFDLSANKMRAKLLTSVSSRPIKDVMPELSNALGDIPRWAEPESDVMTAEAWLQFIIQESERKVREYQADNRSARKQLEDEPVFVVYRSEAEVKKEMDAVSRDRMELARVNEAASRVSYLEGKKQSLEEQVDQMEMEIEIAKAEAAEKKAASGTSEEAVEERYLKLAEEYKVIGAQTEIEEQRDELKENLSFSEEKEKEFKELRDRFRGAEETLLQSAKQPFEESISAVTGKKCFIDLKNGGCVIKLDGVDISALSDGETLSIIPGIVAGLAKASKAKWLPLPMDRFEAISQKRREPFLAAVRKLVDEGLLSQAIIVGCPDSSTKSNGCVQYRMSGGRVEENNQRAS